MMATMSTQFSLGVPDHDTDMLSDGAAPDIDIDIDLDEPSLTGDHDDYMAEGFEQEVNDEDMLVEDYDETRTNGTNEMFDGAVDEDDQMANIDFDDPEQFAAGTTDNSFAEELVLTDHVDVTEHAQVLEDIISHDTTKSQLTAEDNNEVAIEAETTAQTPDAHTTDISEPQDASVLLLPAEISDIQPPFETTPDTTNRNDNPEEEEIITFDDDDVPEVKTTTTSLQSELNPPATTENEQPEDTLNLDEVFNDQVQSEEHDHDDSHLETHEEEEEQYDESADEEYNDYTYDVIVEYDNSQLSLFPPTHHHAIPETFLLQDRSLADQEISLLFSACREVLGGSISEHQALEIDIPLLDLCIHEDSSECASISLSQIVDVYFRLHQNDGVEDPYPLTLTLKTRNRFVARLHSLSQAAEAAQGYGEITSQPLTALRTVVLEEEEEESDEIPFTEGLSTIEEGIETSEFVEDASDPKEPLLAQEEVAHLDTDNKLSQVNQEFVLQEHIELNQPTAERADPEQEPQAIDLATHTGALPITEEHVTIEEIVPNEEDDLIDYSDDELEPHEESTRSSTVKDDDSNPSSVIAAGEANDNETSSSTAHPDGDTNHDFSKAPNEVVTSLEADGVDPFAGDALEHIPSDHEFVSALDETTYELPTVVEVSGGDIDAVDHSGDGEEHEQNAEDWYGEEPEADFEQVEEVLKLLPNDSVAIEEAANEVDEDQINWEDDDEAPTQNKSDSPLGKRTFDEHAEGVEDNAFDQEAKRVKST